MPPLRARTTPAVRAAITRSREPTGVPHYGVTPGTVCKCRKRGPEDCRNGSARTSCPGQRARRRGHRLRAAPGRRRSARRSHRRGRSFPAASQSRRGPTARPPLAVASGKKGRAGMQAFRARQCAGQGRAPGRACARPRATAPECWRPGRRDSRRRRRTDRRGGGSAWRRSSRPPCPAGRSGCRPGC